MNLPSRHPAVDETCQRMLDHLAAMVRVWTPTTGVTYVNRAWRTLTGSSLDANVGEGWLRFVHPDDRAGLATSAPGSAVGYRLVTDASEPVPVVDTSAEWTSEDGAVLGVIHTITPQPAAAPATIAMSKWAHELRGPLNAILGWSDLLSAGDAGPDVLERGLKAIAANARQQAVIIKRMTE
ncbi:hypothetical protein TBR22_A28700 [Luteitalea sp. TBR-22]|uniref:PAS domain-containing protein n=1 Tax=Luteitalea sp. TBR-22 TaxID=2802971 RepID=UPI001AF4DA9E|nr:PAS domain-containing protein [Luteitalea sp. TBR-22]BCS33643.1 hypothetical protein TBR22_A28700 [Luteitalea sp. TBR-22]